MGNCNCFHSSSKIPNSDVMVEGEVKEKVDQEEGCLSERDLNPNKDKKESRKFRQIEQG